MHLEHLLKPLDLIMRLCQVLLQPLLQLRVSRLLDHLRQGLRDLVFGVIDILQSVDEEVVKCFDRLREQAHVSPPWTFAGSVDSDLISGNRWNV